MNITKFPIDRLVPGDSVNARKVGRKIGLATLRASILAHGVMSPLIGWEGPDGKCRIVDGNRRLAAIAAAIKAKKLKKDFPIPVILTTPASDTEALELSLTANTVRQDMHLSDAVEAVAALAASGMAAHEIADRFGETEAWAKRCIRLGAEVAPEIRKQWVDGKITTPQVEALTLTDDFSLQVEIWKQISKQHYNHDPASIRRAIQSKGIGASDPRVVFVGIEAYEMAGGFVRKDLFSDDAILTDGALLDRLVSEKMESEIAALRAEGWKFVARHGEPGFEHTYTLTSMDPREWMTPEEIAAIDNPKAGWQVRDAARKAATARMLDDPEARAQSGVVVSLTHGEGLHIQKAIIHPDDVEPDGDEGGEGETAGASPSAADTDEPGPRLSKPILEGLSETLTVALSRAIAKSPDVAIAAVIAALASGGRQVVAINGGGWSGVRSSDHSDHGFPAAFREALKLPMADRIDRLAALAAERIDARRSTAERQSYGMVSEIEKCDAVTGALVDGLGAGLADQVLAVFDPAIHFARAPAAECRMAAEEIGCLPAIKGLKKGAMAEAVAAEAKRTGWLPPELRTPGYAGPRATIEADDERVAA